MEQTVPSGAMMSAIAVQYRSVFEKLGKLEIL
jgi:hypothetical protein